MNILDPIFYRTLFYNFRQWTPWGKDFILGYVWRNYFHKEVIVKFSSIAHEKIIEYFRFKRKKNYKLQILESLKFGWNDL
jgi:hypothetical protein